MTDIHPSLHALLFPPDPPQVNGTNGTHQPAKATGESTSYGDNALRGEVDAVVNTPEGQRNDRLNVAAFNLSQLVAGGELAASEAQEALEAAGEAAGLEPREIAATIRSGTNAGSKHPRTAPPRIDDTPPVTVLPDEAATAPFWGSRPRLQALHDWAKARRASPWAVLGVTLARVVAATDHRIVIPPIIGGVASLNLFVGIVGVSGGGKGAAEAVAAEAFKVDGFETHRTGSGEGIAHSYMKRVKGGGLEQHQTKCLFSVSEIDTVTALGQRQSATLMPELRSAWSGEALGFAYSDPAKRMPVPKHEYRLCLVIGIQPGRAGALLNDTDGGTPQRFLWLPATDAHVPDVAPDCPEPMMWAHPKAWPATHVDKHRVSVCAEAIRIIDSARVARLRGEGDALDGHALLCRLKTAVALALLEERLDVTDADWDLAGVVQDVSDRTRLGVKAVLSEASRVANEAKGRAEADRTVVVQERVAEAAAKRVTRGILRALTKAGDEGLAQGRLRTGSISSRDRGYFNDGIDRAVKAGLIEEFDTPKGTRYRLTKGAK